ncbi:MAG: DUF1569 domain-containing protein [Gemmataceae bacterium]
MSATIIDTTKVQGRRQLHFSSLDDIAADVEKLAAGGSPRALGNWSAGQILWHLATSMNYCIDGNPVRLPWYLRLLGRVFRTRMLTKPMPAGFKLSKNLAEKLMPPATSWDQGLADFRQAMQRLKNESKRSTSPFLGAMTNDEWVQLHCRHSELHLSFLLPASIE